MTNDDRPEREIDDLLSEDGSDVLASELPVLPLRGTVLFPGVVMPILVGREASMRLVVDAAEGDRVIAVVALRDANIDEPRPEDLFEVGTAARLLKVLRLPNGNLNVIVQGLERVRLADLGSPSPYFRATVEVLGDAEADRDDLELEAFVVSIQRLLQQLAELAGSLPPELEAAAQSTEDPPALADAVAAYLGLPAAEKQEVLETVPLTDRLQLVVAQLSRQVQILELSEKIESEVQGEIDRGQREIYLRERMRAIQRELGEDDEETAEIDDLQGRIDESGMPDEVREAATQELQRLARMSPAAAEYNVVRTYIDWLLDIPWSEVSEDNLDIKAAAHILDEDHYDLEKVKKRILEYLAVRRLKPDTKGPILCFIGPPGVGKTSLGRSIARALGREFVRISLGGIHDEAEIRGHRRTYIGALPGRIVQGVKRAGSMNPVFMLDEIDKLGADFRGDPSSALLEVLDPEQNHAFSDHYLEVPVDLSKVLFIATGNVPENIPDALYDRLEIIELPGYTAEEKVHIAQKYLVPRQLDEHGLSDEQLRFSDAAIQAMVQDYTLEAGVRELERQIAAICRATARRVAEALDAGPDGEGAADPEAATEGEATAEGQEPPLETEVIEPARLHSFLGPVKYFNDVAESTAGPGVATALAWTPTGGDILFVEATRTKGKGELVLTGQLGEIMKESAQAALSYLRAQGEAFGIDPDELAEADIHIHVPAGAIQKDGPSAGVAMLTALASLFSGRPVHSDLGMTGEITLRGLVLPVGGIKNKVLAARRAGLARVLMPAKNEKDLEEIPEQVREGLEFVFVHRMEEVLDKALSPDPAPGRSGTGRRARRKGSSKRRQPAAGARPGPGPGRSRRPAGNDQGR